MIIISYKPSVVEYCPRGCCYEGTTPSECEIAHKPLDRVAAHIATFEGEWAHVIFPETEDGIEELIEDCPLELDAAKISMYGLSDRAVEELWTEIGHTCAAAKTAREQTEKRNAAAAKRKAKKAEETAERELLKRLKEKYSNGT